MFYYISGKLAAKGENYAVIDSGGIGYKIYTSLLSLEHAGETGGPVRMYTHLHVREDTFDLYGFTTQEELSMFTLLISVSGVGTKVAVGILSTLTPSKFALCVVTDDAAAIKSVPGIGPKLAQRIILELKDKFKNEDMLGSDGVNSVPSPVKGEANEAVSALCALGYSYAEAAKAVSSFDSKGMSAEDIIKKALKEMI